MKFERFNDLSVFKTKVLPYLMHDEVCNNLLISIVSDETLAPATGAFMGIICDVNEQIMLISYFMPPFNILLYATDDIPLDVLSGAMQILSKELNMLGFTPPGVFAKSNLSDSFADAYLADSKKPFFTRQMIIMGTSQILPYKRPSGICRVLSESDLTVTPIWEQKFCIDCRIPAYSLDESLNRIRARIGLDNHYIWEDNNTPVSQAVYGRETPNTAVINWVYTPPEYRGCGYATAVVGELASSLLAKGKRSCCLFADADNPISRRIYKKLGFFDICKFTEIHFS